MNFTQFLGRIALEIRREGKEDVPKTFRVISTLLLSSFLLHFIPRSHNSKIADPKQLRFWQEILWSTSAFSFRQEITVIFLKCLLKQERGNGACSGKLARNPLLFWRRGTHSTVGICAY